MPDPYGMRMCLVKFTQHLLEIPGGKPGDIFRWKVEHGKKVLCDIDRVEIKTHLIATQFNTCHFHDTQEFCGGCQNILTQLCNCLRKLIELANSRAGESRQLFPVFLCDSHLCGELGNRMRQQTAGDQAGNESNEQSQHNGCHQNTQQLPGKIKQV